MTSPLFGTAGTAIALQLLIWSVACMGASIVALAVCHSEFWRAFWLVCGIWCFVNCIIALAGLVGTPAALPALRRLLLINAGLDVVYVAVGAVLLSRRSLRLRGSGLAVVVQGLFLLIFDTVHAMLLPPV
jgi:MFS family permease